MLELARQRRTANRGQLEVRQAVGMLNGLPDVLDDLGCQAQLPRRIVELLGIVAERLVVEEPFDRRRPVERAPAHVRRPLDDRLDDVLGIFRRARKTGVLEVVDARGEAPSDLLRAM